MTRCDAHVSFLLHELIQLNHAVSLFLGTEALNRLWVPVVLRAQQSFLSCVWLGANHLDIMGGLKSESATTITLRTAVIQEINENLIGPASEVSDFTMLAILQVIAAEVVNGDVLALRCHIAGLTTIIQQRGLRKLGFRGLIAGALPP